MSSAFLDDGNMTDPNDLGVDLVTQIMYDMKKYNIVTDVLPPPNHEDLHVMIMAVSYLLLFLLGVCHPQRKFLRSRNFAITILLVLAVYAFISLCPLLWSFTAREIILYAKETGPSTLTRMKIEKCTVDIDSSMFTAFTIYQFILCYCTPLILIAYFYTKLLSKLREHTRTFKSSQIPFLHISLYTLAVACFYFLCWTPFWMATVFAVYLENSANSSSVPPVFVYIMYFIHALPFTNSAINWILYGALNGQLQHRYRSNRTSSTKKTTTTTPGGSQMMHNKTLTTLQTSSNYQVNGSMTSIAAAGNSSAPTVSLTNGNNEIVHSDYELAMNVVDVRLLSSHNPTFL
uniref:G_PROTEIN_RECEP_F1_2 domain-containing protein n=1 Tax=Caenorhabditis japonica TaxID=281687 RepID=A0A8R1HJL1_CAEJA